MPESQGYLDAVDYLMMEHGLSRPAAEAEIGILDFRAYLSVDVVSFIDVENNAVPLGPVLDMLTQPPPHAALSLAEAEAGIKELESKHLIAVDPRGWANWQGTDENGQLIGIHGPTRFLETLKHFQNSPKTYRYETASDDECIKIGGSPGKVIGIYAEDLHRPPTDAVFSFSPGVELLIEPEFPEDWKDWRDWEGRGP